MPEIVQFKRDTDPELIEALRKVLAEAESGEIVSYIMVKVRYDGSFQIQRDGKSSQRELIGSLVFAIFDTIAANHNHPITT